MNVECGHLGQRIRLAECILRRSAGRPECLKCSTVFGQTERGHGSINKVEDMADDIRTKCKKCGEFKIVNERFLCSECMDRVSFDGELDKWPVVEVIKPKPKKTRAAGIKELEVRVAALEKAVAAIHADQSA